VHTGVQPGQQGSARARARCIYAAQLTSGLWPQLQAHVHPLIVEVPRQSCKSFRREPTCHCLQLLAGQPAPCRLGAKTHGSLIAAICMKYIMPLFQNFKHFTGDSYMHAPPPPTTSSCQWPAYGMPSSPCRSARVAAVDACPQGPEEGCKINLTASILSAATW
jgi:hypothetical protein